MYFKHFKLFKTLHF